MSDDVDVLKKQLLKLYANVQYTFIAHWKIINRLDRRNKILKLVQILITALLTGGIINTIISGLSNLAWLGGVLSAVELGINLYTLDSAFTNQIKLHKDAADELWYVRERYESVLVDYDSHAKNEVRTIRDELIDKVNKINKHYPGTDVKGFKQAKKHINDYLFEKGEAENLHS